VRVGQTRHGTGARTRREEKASQAASRGIKGGGVRLEAAAGLIPGPGEGGCGGIVVLEAKVEGEGEGESRHGR
jgi:hypothetical protein